jgi:hypothetical protein
MVGHELSGQSSKARGPARLLTIATKMSTLPLRLLNHASAEAPAVPTSDASPREETPPCSIGPVACSGLSVMLTESLLLTLLLSAPSTPPPELSAPEFDQRLAFAELTGNADELQLIGYDTNGEPIGTIAIWTDSRGAVHIEHDYQDGYASIVIIGDRPTVTGTLVPDIVSERAEYMAERLRASDEPVSGPKARCARRLALAGVMCAPLLSGNPWGVGVGIVTCPYNVIEAWCKCAPLFGANTGADVCD